MTCRSYNFLLIIKAIANDDIVTILKYPEYKTPAGRCCALQVFICCGVYQK